ncbi:type II CRISPR RNA-guided endonuclease Cas9 [Riemerella columbina]|uniref:type II CRISPR RNA-guided endonuclease Cas9 n=1 Tax=Riemerella columbina TaxID=103810 RepID=UPI00266F8CE1|nr:type II CRISPR RNA-guided endonuclease Cas9 [Riemerella columbina]WKS94366.1 CRISPR-associated protein Csn1 [Riemerella columbina]
MKRILGLDLGTNSIGWALIEQDFENKKGRIIDLGVRIIPMSQDILGKFSQGQSLSQTAQRTNDRGRRRLYERHILRRERLHRVLNILKFLPQHYAQQIDFEQRKGKFFTEIKLNYKPQPDGTHSFLFEASYQEMLSYFQERGYSDAIPKDWTLYYLRKKALNTKISREELAWIILNFNKKRGYYELRDSEENQDDTNQNSKTEEFYALKVVSVEKSEDKENFYDIHLDNGFVYAQKSNRPLYDWVGMTKEFIVTTKIQNDGMPKTDNEANVERSFRMVDSKQDWIAIKKKTEQEMQQSHQHLGAYIFDKLLENPTQKIKGKLIQTIERKFYKQELNAILEKQKEFHPELNDRDLYLACVEELYPLNEAHKQNLIERDFTHLFVEDIIFYQRPLKSKKSTIATCDYERRGYYVKGEKHIEALKGIPKSHPLFQEFRLWQFLQNLKIYKKEGTDQDGKIEFNQDVTHLLLPDEEAYTQLFDFLKEQKEIEQKRLLRYFNSPISEYTWNYSEDKKYPLCPTRHMLISKLKQVTGVTPQQFLTKEIEQHLWHIIYSVKDAKEYQKALISFAQKHHINEESFVENFKKIPSFPNEYGAYSEKAIKKLLPLMRMGKYWNENDITPETKENIKLSMERLTSINYDKDRIPEVSDDYFSQAMLKCILTLHGKNPLKGLNTYQACYAVYRRHSEPSEISHWKHPDDIAYYLKHTFKQHQLKNPIVEQVVTETFRVVHDIWKHYGNGAPNFFSEIHLELGRDIKNTNEQKNKINKKYTENANRNQLIISLLEELSNDDQMERKPRPSSISHQELLKVYEEGVFYSQSTVDKEIESIRKTSTPTKNQIIKYKLWLEQGYISPYTLKPIPLSKLFTDEYEIEHIIPQSRYFDNSLNNKVICESVVNRIKDNTIATQFINSKGGDLIDLGKNNKVRLATFEAYEAHCMAYFRKNPAKLKNLLAEEVPSGFIKRQLNDSRYISKFIKGILSNIVREEGEKEATAKRLVPVFGAITARLRKDWGLQNKWNAIVQPRFERLNELNNNNLFGAWDPVLNRFILKVPQKDAKDFSVKRIDHRHHALDALIIACTTKGHIEYITHLETARKSPLVSRFRKMETQIKKDPISNETKKISVAKEFLKPWDKFTTDAYEKLRKIIISFKQNNRIINRTNNYYQKWERQASGEYKKTWKRQGAEEGKEKKNFAVRKSMHKESTFGQIKIKRIKKGQVSLNTALQDWTMIVDDTLRKSIGKIVKKHNGNIPAVKNELKNHPITQQTKFTIYEEVDVYASRKKLDDSFTQKQLNSVTDSGIQTILQNHVNQYLNDKGELDFATAFSPEGIKAMNDSIQTLNINKKNKSRPHQPIYSVRIYEESDKKFSIGETFNKDKKYAEADKGTNLFYAIYWNDESNRRTYETVPLYEVIEHQKQCSELPLNQKLPLQTNPEKGQFLFSLSPNDLVYIPTKEEREMPQSVDFQNLTKEQHDRIYRFVSCTENTAYFVPMPNAKEIIKNENGTNNKSERVQLQHLDELDSNGKPLMIKDVCWKIEVNRVGNITKVNR